MSGKFLFVALAATLSFLSDAWAEEPSETGALGPWTFSAIPYIWATSISLDMDISGIATGREVQASTDIDFLDIVDEIDFGVLSRFEADNGPYGAFVDFMYIKLSDDIRTNSFDVGPLSVAPIQVDIDLKTLIVEFGGKYRLWQGSLGTSANARKASLAAVAAARYSAIEIDASLATTVSGPLGRVHRGVTSAVDTSEGIWDPIIGADIKVPVASSWMFRVRGDVGPFGVGSDFTWSVAGIVSYQAWRNTSLEFGYRALSYEFDETEDSVETELDLLMYGPLLSITFRW